MPQNYDRTIPDAPLPISMLPRANALTLQDLLLLTQPGNPQGQRSKALSLQLLAQFLGNMHFDSIVLQGSNGKSLTLTGNGTTFTKPHGSQSDQRDYTITENDDGITLQVTGPNGTQKILIGYTTLEISSTATGLTQKITLGQNGLTISNQTRVNGEVVTQTSKFGWDELRARILGVMIDENNVIPLYWDNTNAEFVVWDRTNNNKVGLPKVHVHGTLEVEKDTTIRADVSITKTLTVVGRADFDGNYTVIKNLFATEYTELKGVSKLEMNMDSGAIIKCSGTPNPTLPNDAAVGTRVIVLNDTENNHTVTFGLYTLTLNGHTAAEFLHATNDTNSGWYKLT